MKKILLFLPFFVSIFLHAQQYPSYKINLISHLDPNTTNAANDNRRYSGCWGWYQASTHKEYFISGTSKGTYFIDVSSPATPSICAYVEGSRESCIWREIKSYQHYCYIVSDDASPNKLQIVDMQYLPDSVHVVYSGTSLFERAHTIWIDNDKLYAGGPTYTVSMTTSSAPIPLIVFSLANPENPVQLRRLDQDISNSIANYVHDMYVRNDTIYASCAFQGFQVFKYNETSNTFSQLGSYTGYPQAGYNHSSAMTKNGKYMVFCDESPAGLPIHLIDVQNLSNIQELSTLSPHQGTTPHNPYILGNDFAIVACYQDGLQIYNISQQSLSSAGYFDTYPQGGYNTSNYNNDDYAGNWGAYPFLPSGLVIAQDMQNGIFILDATEAFNNTVGLKTNATNDVNLIIYPNPVSDRFAINYKATGASHLEVKDMLGRVVYEKQFTGAISDYVNVKSFENGSYVVTVTENNFSKNKQLIINH